MIKIAYLHNLPLEYYPPASNFLDILGRMNAAQVRAFTTTNRKGRAAYMNSQIRISRSPSPDPEAHESVRFLRAIAWHLKTALSLARFRPDAVVYVEPHSAIAAWIYFRLLLGKGRLFIHHHEYYSPGDYHRPGMRLPRLGSRFERNYLFGRAEWISQTNSDRLRLAKDDFPDVPAETWQVLPNYPPAAWMGPPVAKPLLKGGRPLRLIYVGSASFVDTYIQEIVRWTASYPENLSLHVCGYNVAPEVWHWLELEQFENITFDSAGYAYEDLPGILSRFDVGLVLYRGNTVNFVHNLPNKVFEYLRCGMEVWYPEEMTGMKNLRLNTDAPLRELCFSHIGQLNPCEMDAVGGVLFNAADLTSEKALRPLMERLGLEYRSGKS